MPGIKVKIDVEEARVATDKLRNDLKKLGLETKLTERETKSLESRMRQKLGADKADEAIQRLGKSVGLTRLEIMKLQYQSADTHFKGMSSMLATLRQGWMQLGLAAAGAMAAGYTTLKVWETAAKAIAAEDAFGNITRQLKINSDQLISSMKAAGKGTMDDSDIMQSSLKALAQDIEGIEDKLPQVMEAARVASRLTGDTVQDSFEKIVQGLATDMPRGIKQIGLITKDQMQLIERATASGVSNIKMIDMVLTNAAAKGALLNMNTKSSYESLQTFKAEMHEFYEWGSKKGLFILEKLAGGFIALAGGIDLAGAAIKKYNATKMRESAAKETDPARKKEMLEIADRLEREARGQVIEGYNRSERGRAMFTGEKPNEITPGQRQLIESGSTGRAFKFRENVEGGRSLSQYRQDRAAEERKQQEQELRDAANSIEVAKQKAENIKTINASELREMEANANARVAITKMTINQEWLAEKEGIEEREKINAEWYKRRLGEIAAEGDAKMAANKNFLKEDRDRWVAAESNVAKYEKQARDAEVKAQKAVNDIRKELYDIEQEQARIARVRANELRDYELQTKAILTHTEGINRSIRSQIAFEQELANVRARYGKVTPQEMAEQDMDARRENLNLERETLEIRAKRIAQKDDITDEDMLESLQIAYEMKDVEERLLDLETLRAEKLKEFSGTYAEGMATGIRRFRIELGSEFQIWETMAYDSARAMSGTFEEFFFDALSGKMQSFSDYWKSFADGLRRALAQALAKATMNTIIDAGTGGLGQYASAGMSFLIGGLGGFTGGGGGGGDYSVGGYGSPEEYFNESEYAGRAGGGSVGAGTPYIVGEKGPEVFVPGSAGNVIPNSEIGISVPITINGGGTSKAMIAELRSEIEKTAEAVVRRHS